MSVDYLIVGQGIVGSLLCECLMNKGRSVKVVDDGHHYSASAVAAGMVNPIMGRRLNKTNYLETYLPRARDMYSQIEQRLEKSFYHPTPIIKAFSNAEQKRLWNEKKDRDDYSPYVGEFAEELQGIIKKPHGAFTIQRGGWLDMPLFIQMYRQWLEKTDRLIEEKLDYESLHLSTEGVHWNGIEANRLVFCEGYSTAWNPYFDWSPFKLAKGEILTVEAPDLPQEYAYNSGVYVIPIGGQQFRVGATYEWENFELKTTEKACQKLTRKLDQLITVNYAVIDQQVGVRPTMKDRNPLLGQHPLFPQLYILNGMGTKAALMTPYFAQLMTDYLEEETPLPKKIDVERGW